MAAAAADTEVTNMVVEETAGMVAEAAATHIVAEGMGMPVGHPRRDSTAHTCFAVEAVEAVDTVGIEVVGKR